MNEKFILALIDKFDASAAAELDINDGTTHLVLRKAAAFNRGGAAPAGQDCAGGTAVQESAGHTGAAGNQVHLGLPVGAAGTGKAGALPGNGNETITSPIVATYYGAPGPDAPPFVKPGSKVKAGDSLCILEAMKMMNHLEAEFDCEIVSVMASNGDLVEYGQALFEVKRL